VKCLETWIGARRGRRAANFPTTPYIEKYAERYNSGVMHRTSGIVFTSLMLFSPAILRCQGSDSSVSTCDKETLARPGFGVSYSGAVRNDDYRFSATIPEGFVGWGAAPNAPFHGFVIFTGPESQTTSCIIFRIAIHVDLGEDDAIGLGKQKSRSSRVRIGNRIGSQTSAVGSSRGMAYETTHVWLELPRHGYRNDVEIALVTPNTHAAKTKAIFAKFLASFRFW
jgi:hypothetical protein